MKKKKIALLVGVIALILLSAVVIMAAIGGHDTPKPTEPTNTPTVPTTQGTEPTQPTQPTVTEPTEPTEGTEPTDPVAPTDPTDPVDPTDPTEPVEPTDPAKPTNPTEPEKPTEPTDPTEPVHNHNYKAKEVVEPTCTEEGYTLYVCECGDSYHGANVAALGHSNTEKVTEPTCTKEGYTTYTCARCGEVSKGNTVNAKGHSYGEWAVETEPTCTKDGCNVRTCSDCGHKDKETVDALGHEMTEGETVAPTCTKDGYTELVCAACGKKDKTAIPATGHKMEDTAYTSPTCTAPGSKEQTCANCGKKTTEEIPAAGHTWGSWETIKEPTATEDGECKRTCSVCGVEETQVVDHNHTHNWEKVIVQPGSGCLDDGYEQWVCSVCGYEGKKEYKTYLLAPGHDWSEWEVSQEPGPGVAGEEKRHCKRCGIEQTLPIEPLDENGEKLESYIDPKVEQKTSIAGNPNYYYGDIVICDMRKTWGDYLSIVVNEDDSVTVRFYDKNGELVEIVMVVMESYDLTCLDIREDGTYSLYGFNGFH